MHAYNIRNIIFWGALAIGLLILSSGFFIVDQRQCAIVFQFGKEIRVIDQPGLKFKVPLIQEVSYFDRRLLNIEVEAKELTAADGKRIIVDALARYRIQDPVRFYKTVYNHQGLKIRLNKILEGGIRKVIGKLQLSDLLSNARSNIMTQIRDIINQEAENFGILVEDVRIKRADLPQENSAAIYKRMQTEREKEAKQIRAEGHEEAARIRSIADKKRQLILAEAHRQSEIIKGEGEEIAALTYNTAYRIDPDFYKFYRYLEAYKNSFADGNTHLVISPSSQFLKYLNIGER